MGVSGVNGGSNIPPDPSLLVKREFSAQLDDLQMQLNNLKDLKDMSSSMPPAEEQFMQSQTEKAVGQIKEAVSKLENLMNSNKTVFSKNQYQALTQLNNDTNILFDPNNTDHFDTNLGACQDRISFLARS